MSAVVNCGGCQMGEHSRHIVNHTPAPPGVLGGACCGCTGDCKPPDLEKLFGAPPTRRASVSAAPDDPLCDHHPSVIHAASRQHDHDPEWIVQAAAQYVRQCCGRFEVNVQTWVGTHLTSERDWLREDFR